MVTLTAEYFGDIGRIRVTAGALLDNVSYTLQRNTAIEPTWVDVRGGGNISTSGSTVIDDYEYTPNVENCYRLIVPAFYDSFNRVYPTGGALAVSGNALSRADTPDAASLDITGDIDLRAVIDFEDYSNGNQTLVAKYTGTGNQRSYALRIDTNGNLAMLYSLNGSTALTATASSTVYSVGAQDGRPLTVRVTRVSATGVITFYIGNEVKPNPVTWTQIGTTIAGTSGALFSGTALLEVGTLNAGASDMSMGNILFAQVRNGIAGAIVANPDFTAQAPGTLSFVDSTGKTWTMRGTPRLSRMGRFPEPAGGPLTLDRHTPRSASARTPISTWTMASASCATLPPWAIQPRRQHRPILLRLTLRSRGRLFRMTTTLTYWSTTSLAFAPRTRTTPTSPNWCSARPLAGMTCS